MKSEKITNHGTLMDSTNYNALINVQAKREAFVDNKNIKSETSIKETNGPKLVKTIHRPQHK